MSATATATAGSEVYRPSVSGWVARRLVLLGIFSAVLLITANVPGYWADRIGKAAIYAVIGLSLNIILGYVGQVSLGHHGFVGIAAFVAAYYVTEKSGCIEGSCALGAFGVATFIAILSGAAAAGLLGLVALRIKGLYLALITLAYGFMAETSIFEIPALTGGGAGMPAPRPRGFTTDHQYAFLCFAFLALVIFIDWRLLKSKLGRATLSIKNSDAVAASYGINVTAYKVLAFILSGAFAGLAGSLLAFHATNVVSNDFVFSNALLWVLMVVVGGLGNRVGVVIGSAFFALFPFILESLLAGGGETILNRPPDYFTLVIGPALALLTIIQFPGGIAEQISPITRWLGGQKFSMHPEGAGHGKSHGKTSGGTKKRALARLGLDKPKKDESLGAVAKTVQGDGTTTATAALTKVSTDSNNGSPDSIDAPDVWGNLTGSKGRG